ncbi:hypothetical protein P692DRAFT_20836193 [Suillus brevipes Sb2]|nr:hypothetical protein P692DRAFT_20836193 [Suillus brevipes Sb2]
MRRGQLDEASKSSQSRSFKLRRGFQQADVGTLISLCGKYWGPAAHLDGRQWPDDPINHYQVRIASLILLLVTLVVRCTLQLFYNI